MDNELLSILACPKCRGQLSLIQQQGVDIGLDCAACAVRYPVKDDIPVLLVEEALPLALSEQGTGGN